MRSLLREFYKGVDDLLIDICWRIDMPHIEIQCFAGRTEEQKKQCADRIADIVAETLGCKTSSVSVAITDIPEDEWKEKVWDKCIAPVMNNLYKKPGYTCE